MKSSLTTVQHLHKAGQILSIMAFFLSLLAAVIALLVLVLDAAGFKGLKESSSSDGELYFTLMSLIFVAAGEAVTAKYALGYFKAELRAGHPFVRENSIKLRNLGLLVIIIPFITFLLSTVLRIFLERSFGNVGEIRFRPTVSVASGLMFIVLSLICRYGAELEDKGDNQ